MCTRASVGYHALNWLKQTAKSLFVLTIMMKGNNNYHVKAYFIKYELSFTHFITCKMWLCYRIVDHGIVFPLVCSEAKHFSLYFYYIKPLHELLVIQGLLVHRWPPCNNVFNKYLLRTSNTVPVYIFFYIH